MKKGALVQFVGPRGRGPYWPKPGELGLIEHDAEEDAARVRWELAGGPAAWPMKWLRLMGGEDAAEEVARAVGRAPGAMER